MRCLPSSSWSSTNAFRVQPDHPVPVCEGAEEGRRVSRQPGPAGHGDRTDIFQREGEKITVSGRPEPIRVARSTPSIAALLSLLPENDDLQEPLSAVTSFFAGIRYYALEERAEYRDFVTEHSTTNG